MATNALGKKLKNAREARGYTVRKVQRLAGVSNGYVTLVELGQTKPKPAMLRGLSKALDLNYLELMILAGHLTIRDLKGRV